MADAVLYDYWRSSSSYRVRIALNLLGIAYEPKMISLVDKSHLTPDYLDKNAQGLVPTLEIDGHRLTQSLAIIEYLNETRPGCGLLPDDLMGTTRVRTLAYAVAMEIQPLGNLKTINHVIEITGGDNRHTPGVDGQVHRRGTGGAGKDAGQPADRTVLPWRYADHGRLLSDAATLQR